MLEKDESIIPIFLEKPKKELHPQRTSFSPAPSVEKEDKFLKSLAGDYICFRPDFEDPTKPVVKVDLHLSYPYIGSDLKRDYNILKAEYKWNDYTKTFDYQGKARIKRSRLYMRFYNDKEDIYNIAKIDTTRAPDIIQCISSCVVDGKEDPISYHRVIVKDDFLNLHKEVEAQISRFLQAQPGITSAMSGLTTVEKIREENKKYEFVSELTPFYDTWWYSYNMFSRDENVIYQNVWHFQQKGNKLRATRYGANGRTYEGELTYIRKHLFFTMWETGEIRNKRSYIAPLATGPHIPFPEEIKCLGMSLYENSYPVAGKEILIRSSTPLKEDDTKRIHNPKEVSSSVTDFLGEHENASMFLKPAEKYQDRRFEGDYLVYFIHSRSKRLVRNKARINFSTEGVKFHYETFEKKIYPAVFTSFSSNALHIQLKELQESKDYFSFHFKAIDSETKQHLTYISGSASAISTGMNLPMSYAVILRRIESHTWDDYKTGLIEESEILSDEEQIIFSYLNFHASNPILVRKINKLDSATMQIAKEQFFSNLKNNISGQINPNLQRTHKGFITSLVDILSEFTNDNQITLKSEHTGIFRIFYDELLTAYAGETCGIFASSLPSEKYFWPEGNSSELKIREFINAGGKMHRIFLIDSDQPDPSEIKIIKRHFGLYGEDNSGGVYVTNIQHPTVREQSELIEIFSTENLGKLSWKVITKGPNGVIDTQSIYMDEDTHQELMDRFNTLISLKEATIRVTREILAFWE
ncbi:MAG: hypothetical protein SF052_20795 [Bacteroidia bacterium]|nr:hypothetical protein [Bacteroidia bacterium]